MNEINHVCPSKAENFLVGIVNMAKADFPILLTIWEKKSIS